ncbi:MAG: hypothetical protein AB2L11_11965 [Syntrophobacteraceae bacterium]
MKVYFDLYVYNRLGSLTMMALIGEKQIRSINSFVLDYENRKNPKPENVTFIDKLLAESSEFVQRNDNIGCRAYELEKKSIMGIDALHVACAEEAGADYFVSCDNVLVEMLNKIKDIKVQASTLSEFVSRELF